MASASTLPARRFRSEKTQLPCRQWGGYSLLALLCLVCLGLAGCQTEAGNSDPVALCDRLASHPHDPERQAAGVTDDQMAPGAAIEACRGATAAQPETGRLWFELGRSYWVAEREAEAFDAFVQAAKRGNAAAMKYIGDAFLEGRGLPPGAAKNANTALSWYRKAQRAGFREAAKAIEEVKKQTLDASLFQRPDYIQAVFDGDMSGIDSPPYFMTYLNAFVSELGGDKILYVDSHCKPLVTGIGQLTLTARQLISYGKLLKTRRDRVLASLSFLASPLANDQGERDAVTLTNEYHCDSPVARKLVGNVVVSYAKIDSLLAVAADRIETRMKQSDTREAGAEQ